MTPLLVIMGVSGCGKSTLAGALAETLEWRLVEADHFHSSANIEKMAAGKPLTDSDRGPWIAAIAGAIDALAGKPCVLACSALTPGTQSALEALEDRELTWIWLEIDGDTARARLSARPGHFMPPALVDSQLAALRVPPGATRLDGCAAPEANLASVRAIINSRHMQS